MSDIETGSETGATPEGSASPETASPAQSQETAPAQEAQATPAQKEQSFDTHPRFRELIDQKNQYQQQLAQMQKNYQQMQAQMQKIAEQQSQYQQPKQQAPTYDELFKELEQLNPTFGKSYKDAYGKLQEVDQLKQEFSSLREQLSTERRERDSVAARNQFSQLCAEKKISEADSKIYDKAVRNLAYERQAKMEDLPALFNEVHDELSKFFETRDRSLRESYVKNKTADQKPASQSGGTPAGLPGAKGPSNPDEVKALLVERLRAARAQ